MVSSWLEQLATATLHITVHRRTALLLASRFHSDLPQFPPLCWLLLALIRHPHKSQPPAPAASSCAIRKKRKDYTFWRQFNEKPSIIPGCPGIGYKIHIQTTLSAHQLHNRWTLFMLLSAHNFLIALSAHCGQLICTLLTTCLHNVYNSSAHCVRLVLNIAYLPSEDAARRSSGRQAKGVWPSHHNASFPLPIWHRILQTAWSHITDV